MNIIARILDFSRRLYEETCAVPVSITLPTAAFDMLVGQAAERLRDAPSLVPGTIPCVQVETGHGIVCVYRSAPTLTNSDPKDGGTER